MQTLSQLHDDSLPFEEEERSHGRRLLVGILCALLLTGAIFGGYLFLRKRHERQLAAAAIATRTKALAGAARPPMEAPSAKTVIVNRPARRGEEFINTPNNPVRVP